MTKILMKSKPWFSYGKPVIGSIESFLFFFIAFMYGFFLSQLPDVNFKDYVNYLNYVDSAWLIVKSNLDNGIARTLSNEPVWLLINFGLGFFLDPDTVVRTIIFFSASSVAWLILMNYPQHFIWLILILLMPQVVKNYLIHLRQGLGVAVFLWGWFSVGRTSRFILLGMTPFIHASFFLIISFLVLAWIMRLFRLSPVLMIIIYMFFALTLSMTMGIFAEFFGARQSAQYQFQRADVSGLGFLLWSIILLIMFTTDKLWQREHIFAIGIVIFYLITYLLITFSARIFESGLLVVLLSLLSLRGWRRSASLGVVFSAAALIWGFQLASSSFLLVST
jgi:hypothetical protein